MSIWKRIAPLGALAAAGAAAALILRKKKAAAAPQPAPAGKKAAPKEVLMKTGEYSFVSGFKDARTVSVALDYDALRFGFDVIGEDFPVYSSDSHVAVISGEDFSVQMEYASYYKDEDLAFLTDKAQKEYKGFAPVTLAHAEGFRYRAGDGICFCLGVDEYSYLLLTLLRAEGCDKSVEELAGSEDMTAMLESLRYES